MLLNLALLLWRDSIKTATACIPFYRDNSKAITVTFANLFITGKQAAIHMLPCFGSQFIKMLFFFFVCRNDLFQFALFICKHTFFSCNILFCFFQCHCL